MITPDLKSYLSLVDELDLPKTLDRYSYGESSLIKLFLYALVKGISGFKTLHDHLLERPEVLALVGLDQLPHRTTLSRRFKRIPKGLQQAMTTLHEHFIETGIGEASVMSADSSLMHAEGNVWHSKDRKARRLPSCGNIDQEAHWGISGQGEWVFGYRLHCLVNADATAPLPRNICVYPANVKDAQVFSRELSASLSEDTNLVLADGGYDEQPCYDACDERGISLIAPLQVKTNTPEDRCERARLYNDPEVREVFALRKATVEPFQGRLKALFKLEHLLVKGLANVRALVTLAALAYLLLAYFNLRLGRDLLCLKQTMLALR